jgi:amino acid transporter
MRGHKLKREAGRFGLLYASLSGIIGSGWLLGPLYAAQIAGPYSVFSWLLGAGAVLLLALVFAELATLIPRSGALVHISHLSHGDLVGRVWSWILFIAYVTVPPVEVTAVLTYANNYLPGLVRGTGHILTLEGYATAIALLLIIVWLNFLTIRWVLAINSTATWWKIAIALGTVVLLLRLNYHPANLRLALGHLDSERVLRAISLGGIIFSFLGFRQAIDLAGETPDPRRNIPFAAVGSILLAALIYAALQFAFLTALPPSSILRNGWHGLSFAGSAGPLAALVILGGAVWWAGVLYINAIISPLGTGFIYTTTTSRIIMAAGESGDAPAGMAAISRRGVPWTALLLTFVVGVVFLVPFPSWQKLVSVISSATVLSYGIGPIVLLQLRLRLPEHDRPFRLRGAWFIAPAAFVVSNWIIYWTGLKTSNYVFGILLGTLVVYLALRTLRRGKSARAPLHARHAWWLLPYFGGLWLIQILGPHSLGGDGTMSFLWGNVAVALLSFIVLTVALLCGRSPEAIEETFSTLETIDRAPPLASP